MHRMDVHPVFSEIEALYARAPSDLSEDERLRWMQRHCEIACPECGESLFVLRTDRAQNRGIYHLAMCQNPDCSFQIDD
ncbi:MAG: hypothetical protein NVSMB22_06780 [Chloroflexota bacterium]